MKNYEIDEYYVLNLLKFYIFLFTFIKNWEPVIKPCDAIEGSSLTFDSIFVQWSIIEINFVVFMIPMMSFSYPYSKNV